MNHEKALSLTKLISIHRFTHSCEEPHQDPKDESCGKYSINFTEKDRFGLRVGKDEWLMTNQEVFFTTPELVFSCRHLEEIPKDVCFSVSFDENFVESIRSIANLSLKNYQPSVKLNNRLAFIYWKLAQSVSDENNRLEVETLAGELFAVTAGQDESNKLFSEKLKKKHFERIEAVCRFLRKNYAENHSLDSISRFVEMSPYHFARTFRELSGVAPHRYLLNIRLEKAKELLLENESVTDTCFAVGFNNFSHFIRTFNRFYGVSPKRFADKKNHCPGRPQNLYRFNS